MNMERLVEIGLANAAAAAVLALIVLAAGIVTRRPALLHALWLIVILKLVTPPLATVPIGAPAVRESNTAALELPPAAPDAVAVESPSPPAVEVSSPAAGSGPASPGAVPRRVTLASMSTTRALGIVWLLGTTAVVLLAAVQTLRFARLLRRGRPAPAKTSAEALEIARRMGLRRTPRIDLVPGAVSPLLWWVPGRAARIVLPADLWARFDSDFRRTVLAHEIAHFARRDHWVRWLELAAAALYWWHPAVWIARREIRRTEDAACDAWVVWAFPECARAYGAALVETVDFLAAARPPALLPGSGIGEARGLKRRLTRIVRRTAPRALSRAGWLVVILTAAVALPFAPGRAEEKGEGERDKPVRLDPRPGLEKKTVDIASGEIAVLEFVRFLADFSGLPVLTGPFLLDKKIEIATNMKNTTDEIVRSILEVNGLSVENSVLPNGDKVLVVKPNLGGLYERIDKLEGKLDQALKDLEALRGRAGTSKDFNYKGKPIGEWIRDLADRDRETREAAINVMNGLMDAVPRLIEAMKSDDVVLRESATLALQRTGVITRQVAEALLRALKDPERSVRDAAATLDGAWIVGEEPAPVLVEALKDSSPLVRSTAARILGRVQWVHVGSDSREKAAGALTGALEDADPEVRRRAAKALRSFGTDAAPTAPALTKLLGDPSDEVALEAALTLATLAPGEATASLVARLALGLQHADRLRRYESIAALVGLGPAARPALPALVEVLSGDEAAHRRWAACAIAAADPKCESVSATKVVGELVEALDYRGNGGQLRTAALDALGLLGPLATDAALAIESKLEETPKEAQEPKRKSSTARTRTGRGVPLPLSDEDREKAAAALKKIRGE